MTNLTTKTSSSYVFHQTYRLRYKLKIIPKKSSKKPNIKTVKTPTMRLNPNQQHWWSDKNINML